MFLTHPLFLATPYHSSVFQCDVTSRSMRISYRQFARIGLHQLGIGKTGFGDQMTNYSVSRRESHASSRFSSLPSSEYPIPLMGGDPFGIVVPERTVDQAGHSGVFQ